MDNSKFTNDWQLQRNANILKEYKKLSQKLKTEAENFIKNNNKKK